MLTVRLDVEEGLRIGDGPDNGAAIKVLARTGRKVHLAIFTNLKVERAFFGLRPPAFAPGLAGVGVPPQPDNHALNCAAS